MQGVPVDLSRKGKPQFAGRSYNLDIESSKIKVLVVSSQVKLKEAQNAVHYQLTRLIVVVPSMQECSLCLEREGVQE